MAGRGKGWREGVGVAIRANTRKPVVMVQFCHLDGHSSYIKIHIIKLHRNSHNTHMEMSACSSGEP